MEGTRLAGETVLSPRGTGKTSKLRAALRLQDLSLPKGACWSRHGMAQLLKQRAESWVLPGVATAGKTTVPSLQWVAPGTGHSLHLPWLSRLMSITPCLTFMCRLRLPFKLNLLEQ